MSDWLDLTSSLSIRQQDEEDICQKKKKKKMVKEKEKEKKLCKCETCEMLCKISFHQKII